MEHSVELFNSIETSHGSNMFFVFMDLYMHAHISDSVMFILTMVYFCQVLCLSLNLNALYPMYYCILFLFVFSLSLAVGRYQYLCYIACSVIFFAILII